MLASAAKSKGVVPDMDEGVPDAEAKSICDECMERMRQRILGGA